MSKLLNKLITPAFIALPLLSVQATAAEEQPDVVDMTSYLCKDIMRMSGEERSVAFGVLHGYVLGKKGAVKYVSSELGKVTDNFIEYCLDNPNEKALASFEKLAK